jgi:hypothetical protein
MARYFFHVRMTDEMLIPDRIGIEFRNLEAAKADAAQAVRETIAEKKVAGEPLNFASLEIADRRGRVLAILRFTGDEPPRRETKQ